MADHDEKFEELTTTPDVEEQSSNSGLTIQSHNGRPECFRSTLQELLFVLTATMAIAASSFLQGNVMVISSFIGRDLHMTSAEISWITGSSALAAGSFLLFFGGVADMFGRKPLFIVSLFLFALCAMVCGFSTNPLYMDVLNGLMGLCSAAAVPPAVGILGAVYEKPSRRKNHAFACFSAGNPMGFAFGSISAGVTTKILGWRAAFWWLAIVYLVLTIIAFFTVPDKQQDKTGLSLSALKRFDFMGALLAVAGIALFSSSLSIAGDAPRGWQTPYVIILLILGLVGMVSFVLWEAFFKYPLMPLGVWRNRDFSLLMGILLLGFMSFSSSGFFLALYLQRVKLLSALGTAVHLLPLAIVGISVNIVAGLILHKVSNKLLMGIGAVSYTGAFLLLSLQKESTPYWAMTFPSLCLTVIGADLEFNVANMYVMSSLPPRQQSIAGGIFNTVTKLCVTIGLGISTAIFNAISGSADTLSESTSPSDTNVGGGIRPYTAVYWFAVASAGASLLLVPWLSIGTQGATKSAMK